MSACRSALLAVLLGSALVAAAAGFSRNSWSAEPPRESNSQPPPPPRATQLTSSGCPPEMVRVDDFCIDRWESTMVDDTTGEPLSPYYPPLPGYVDRVLDIWQLERQLWGETRARALHLPEISLWQRSHHYVPRAVSRANVTPQGYLSYFVARRACERANKRLCTLDEWKRACRGQRQTQFPYGDHYVAGKCNVARAIHPASILHGSASLGHLDPRLNLVVENGSDPVLRATGATPSCISRWGSDGIADMVGNLDEWIEDEAGVFVGGFYSRSSTVGCDARIHTHAPAYFDYSTGTRCCAHAR